MSLTKELLSNTYDVKYSKAITTNSTYTYEELVFCIKNYTVLLSKYKKAGIDRIGIIAKENVNANTICLILALLELKIQPIIINEKIENIEEILENEDIKITFYESIKKPSCLKKCDLLIDDENKYFSSARPYFNVKNIYKISNYDWFLNKMKSEKKLEYCVCKLYDKENDEIIKTNISEEDIKIYAKDFAELTYNGRLQPAINTLPLYKKNGFLYITRALSNDMHLICINDNANKKFSKIKKEKPITISFDEDMLEYLIDNYKNRDFDFSFIQKVIPNVKKENEELLNEVLKKYNYNEIQNNEIEKTLKLEK